MKWREMGYFYENDGLPVDDVLAGKLAAWERADRVLIDCCVCGQPFEDHIKGVCPAPLPEEGP
jgi:hypothetical protein